MNNAKSGYLEGLKGYLSMKIGEIEESFKYGIDFITSDSTASDGSQPNSKANSNPLEAKITFYDKQTENPITDADFKDGFILKIEANANWAITPEVTAEDYKKSVNQLGTINVTGKSGNTFSMDFAGLNLTKDQYQYTAELTIDANGKTDTIDLLDFVKTIESQMSKSKTEYIEMSYISITSENSFYISFNQLSADKVKNMGVVLKVIFNGNVSFAKRDLNVTITSTPEIVTDNSGEYKEAEFNVSTDAESINFESTSIKQTSGTTITIDKNIYANYSKEKGKATIQLSGSGILNAHKTLQTGETAEFEITFTAKSDGYNDKTDVKMTLKIRKGDDLPVITLDDFYTWLNTIEVSGFTKQLDSVGSASITLTASSDISQDTAMNNIKEALKKLSKDKIIIDDNIISYLSWSTYPTGNEDGVIKVNVKAAEGYGFSEYLYGILTDHGSLSFSIILKAKSSWPLNISIDGAGSNASNPLIINLGDGSADVRAPYTIKYLENVGEEFYIPISSLKQADSIPDSWNLVGNQFFDSYEYSTVLNISSDNIMNILNNQDILKDASQVYKVTLTVHYGMNDFVVQEDIDLYVKFIKNYSIINLSTMIKILIEGIAGKPYDGVSSINMNINNDATMDLNHDVYYDNNKFTITDYHTGQKGSITYINNNIRLDNIKNALAKVGLNCAMTSLTFSKDQKIAVYAVAVIDNLSKADGYIFDSSSLKGFDPSAGITIVLNTAYKVWID